VHGKNNFAEIQKITLFGHQNNYVGYSNWLKNVAIFAVLSRLNTT